MAKKPLKIAEARLWNSWDSEHPAAMRFLPLGLDLGFCAYAASKNSFTRFPSGAAGISLGPRRIDGNGIALSLAHAGTELALTYDKPDPFTLRGRWQAGKMAEWGLRFWVMVTLSAGRTRWRYDPKTGELSAKIGEQHVVALGERLPLLPTFHANVEALREEYETKGYFCLDSRGERGVFPVLRYHLEEMPSFTFAVSVGKSRSEALKRAKAALGAPAAVVPGIHGGAYSGALDAVRDVVGWNTVWDGINKRPYTSLSRNWVSQKFGGFGIWLDDILYHALMAGMFDAEVARENLRAVFAGVTKAGNLPCLLTGRDAWIDRSQPPIGAFICWMLYERLGDRDLLREAWPVLKANHEWWWATRDGNGDGMVEYGTSPVGGGLYRGTKLAAKDESSMDNSPTHDEATLNTKSWTLDSADVGLNSLLALDGEMLALIAGELGLAREAKRMAERARALNARIADQLWDPERKVFANRLWSGKFVRSVAPPSFYPLLSGAARPDQAEAMVAMLADPRKFGGQWMLASVTRDDPAFSDNVYWRGRVWPPLNFLVYQGLKRAGYPAVASQLADNGFRLFQGEWRHRRHCPENYNSVSGQALDQPDTDSFYGWGALMPAIAVAELSDINPWSGWEVTHGEGICLGPMQTPLGLATIEAGEGVLRVTTAGKTRFATDIKGRFAHLSIAGKAASVMLPAGPAGWIEFPDLGERVAVPSRQQGLRLEIKRGKP
jgi:putative isomerase